MVEQFEGFFTILPRYFRSLYSLMLGIVKGVAVSNHLVGYVACDLEEELIKCAQELQNVSASNKSTQ